MNFLYTGLCFIWKIPVWFSLFFFPADWNDVGKPSAVFLLVDGTSHTHIIWSDWILSGLLIIWQRVSDKGITLLVPDLEELRNRPFWQQKKYCTNGTCQKLSNYSFAVNHIKWCAITRFLGFTGANQFLKQSQRQSNTFCPVRPDPGWAVILYVTFHTGFDFFSFKAMFTFVNRRVFTKGLSTNPIDCNSLLIYASRSTNECNCVLGTDRRVLNLNGGLPGEVRRAAAVLASNYLGLCMLLL